MKITKEIDKADLPPIHRRLKALMRSHSFEAQMLNVAVLRNCKLIEEEANRLARRKQEIFQEHAATWSEGEDRPDDVEVGDMKTQVAGGKTLPVFESAADRAEAEKKITDLFDGTTEYTFHQVPVEAFEVPDGEPISVWEDLHFMFKDLD